jgi:hypothetical protein
LYGALVLPPPPYTWLIRTLLAAEAADAIASAPVSAPIAFLKLRDVTAVRFTDALQIDQTSRRSEARGSGTA